MTIHTELYNEMVNDTVTSVTKADMFVAKLGIDRAKLYTFFEPILLAKSLSTACHAIHLVQIPPEDEEPEVVHLPRRNGLEKASDCFLNKLAQLCSNNPGASTMTAVVLLQDPESVFYTFSSNDRSKDQLDEMARFVRSLFHTLDVEDDLLLAGRTELSLDLTQKILLFHKDRVKVYLNGLSNELKNAIDVGIEGCYTLNREMTELLQEVDAARAVLSQLCTAPCCQEDGASEMATKYTSMITRLFSPLQTLKQDILVTLDHSRQNNKSLPWNELLHYAGRILSYANAPTILLAAREAWPEIFKPSVEFVLIPSSTPMPNLFPPGRRKATAAEVLTRLFPNVIERDECLSRAAHIQQMTDSSIDKALHREFNTKSFRPYVHAEVLVHDFTVRWAQGIPTPDMFFFNRVYIGVGKPTCRLCWSYLTDFPGMGPGSVRKSHGNLYTPWRMPNSYAAVDETVERARITLIARVRDHLRQLCRQMLEDGRARRKNHDSETSSSRPTIWHPFFDAANHLRPGEITSALQDLELKIEPCGARRIVPARLGGIRGFQDPAKIPGELAPALVNGDIDWAGDEVETGSVGNGSSTSPRSTSSSDNSGSTSCGPDESSPNCVKNDDMRGKDFIAEEVRAEAEAESDGGGVVLFAGRGRKPRMKV